MVTGVELAVGYLFAWAVRKARRVANRVDSEVDQLLDAGLDRLHGVIAGHLGADAALEQAVSEAASGREELTDRTRMRLELALEEAVEQDVAFARELEVALAEVQAAVSPKAVSAGDGGLAVGGALSIRADHGSAAAVWMRDVTLGPVSPPPLPGPDQG